MNEIERRVKSAKRPVALTGAGISAPSDIPTFQGTWKGRPIRDFLSRDYFEANRAEFFELFLDMVSWCDREPNEAHKKLAEWNVPVVTQNIDGLHTRAGSKDVIELHGTLQKVVCPRCKNTMDARAFRKALKPLYDARDRVALQKALSCPKCGAMWDTDVVLYGDNVRGIDIAYEMAQDCDLMLVIGTSLVTYPAAALPDVARRSGAKILMINDDCVGRMTAEE